MNKKQSRPSLNNGSFEISKQNVPTLVEKSRLVEEKKLFFPCKAREMWFKIQFYSDSHPISTVIADRVYFKASDVGKFLGYVNAHNFADRYAKTDFNLTLPENIRPNKRCLVFTFEEMIVVVHRLQHKCKIPICAREMTILWFQGRVDADIPEYPALSFKYAPLLLVRRDAGQHNIQDWIGSYEKALAGYLYRVRDWYEPPPSVVTQEDDPLVVDFTRDPTDSDPTVVPDSMRDPTDSEEDPTVVPDSMRDADDPTYSTRDPTYSTRDPRIASRNRRERPMPYSRPEGIASPEPENPCDLNMDFDAFPPDRIYIKIHGLEYVYTRPTTL